MFSKIPEIDITAVEETFDEVTLVSDVQMSLLSAIDGAKLMKDDFLTYLLEMAHDRLKTHIKQRSVKH